MGEDYYEHGLETGLSNYQNYRWISELTIPMAMTIIDFLNISPDKTILDYGCAKGYLVKALRLLNRKAFGYDISSYALRNADEEIKKYLTFDPLLLNKYFDFIICKDVLEHIPLKELKLLLMKLNGKVLFSVIPLGNKGEYFAPANNNDKSHIICKNSKWWLNLFKECGWKENYNSFKVKGVKDSYYELYPKAHLFTIHTRRWNF
jgi:2-polyprenyl-3-methyl-5-hydroxy-6-metoxy-1,4-benzoquinol methylase